ncbi:MAG: site-2 protease family protein [Anaerolineae bacterium]|nr:site-2 protease family protein [Anaerolineae bacterium]
MLGLSADILLARLVVVFLGIPIHEWAHGWVAHLLGDSTPEREGRLSLNPITHLDPVGTLMILLTGFGWGRAARVNPYLMHRVKNPRTGMALTALAGPLSNFIQAFLLALILRSGVVFLLPGGAADWVAMILLYAIAVNIGLIVFNMLPIPPLDGSRVLAGVAPPRVAEFIERLEPVAPILLIAVLFVLPQLGLDVVSWMTEPLYAFLIRILPL